MTLTRKLSSVAISAVAAHLLWIAPAEATLITDVRNINATLSDANSTYRSTDYGTSFNLIGSGVPASATVLSANVSFSLMNADGQQEVVQAVLGSDSLLGLTSYYFSAFGGEITGSLSALNASGILDYTLYYVGSLFGGSSSNSVYVSQGALMANVVPTSVPEPGTLSLLGAGLLAGWLSSRRRKAQQPTA